MASAVAIHFLEEVVLHATLGRHHLMLHARGFHGIDLVGIVSPTITNVMGAVPTSDFVTPTVAGPRLLMCLSTLRQ